MLGVEGEDYVDVREKRIAVPPIEETSRIAHAWADAIEELSYDSQILVRLLQALINSIHDDVMIKVEKAFIQENRKEAK